MERCRFFKNDTTISRSLEEYGEWAQAEIDFLPNFMGSRDTVLDIGAFTGTHPLAFTRKVSVGGKVYAFEPQPAFYEVLKMHLVLNNSKNVKLFNAAVSEKDGQVEIADVDS